MTLCFVYKVMGLTFHDMINTKLIYRFELAQVVARKISKAQKNFRYESHWLLFYLFFFIFMFGGRGGGLNLFFSSCLIFYLLFRLYISEFTVVCVVTDDLYMCLIHVKGIKNKK